jgi:hypothetical protein
MLKKRENMLMRSLWDLSKHLADIHEIWHERCAIEGRPNI